MIRRRRTGRARSDVTAAVVVVLVAAVGCAADTGDPVATGGPVVVTTAPAPSTAGTDTTTDRTTETTTDATTGASDGTTTAPTTAAPTTTTTAPPATMGDPEVRFTEIARLDRPVGLAVRPGDPRPYVVEQPGRIVVLEPVGDVRTVLDLAPLTEARGERGLLGLAFSTDGARAFVNHTSTAGDTVVAEYAVDADGTFDPASRRVLFEIEQPFGNHNGGHLVTAPDGTLMIGTGDGGSAGDPLRLALDPSSWHGKLLRIDPTPDPVTGAPYRIPHDNPFVGTPGVLGEVFALGLRNPWKFSFDPATGDLWIADVGQNAYEELNRVPAPADGSLAGSGASFGWSAYEGLERFNADEPGDGHVDPVLVYSHGADGCSITGGATARGDGVPELRGGHVYGDYCSGRIWALDLASGRNVLLGEVPAPTAIVPGPDGELMVTSHAGAVLRIEQAS